MHLETFFWLRVLSQLTNLVSYYEQMPAKFSKLFKKPTVLGHLVADMARIII
jgi:hypothetical protein